MINRRVFWRKMDAAGVGKKAYFKCEFKDSLNCPATAKAVLVEEATDTTAAKYICCHFTDEHNHDIEEDILVSEGRRSGTALWQVPGMTLTLRDCQIRVYESVSLPTSQPSIM